MSEIAVAVHGLTKIFKVPFKKERIVAVRDLDLRVEAGPGVRIARSKRIWKEHDVKDHPRPGFRHAREDGNLRTI
jgi:hypothetical protein